MKTNTFQNITLVVFLFFGHYCYSQTTMVSSVGKQKNNTGSISYVIGQTFFNTVEKNGTGSIENVSEGLYEVVVLNVKDMRIDLQVFMYPNPTSNFLNLVFEDAIILTKQLSYSLVDLNGRELVTSKINNVKSLIDMKDIPSSVYFLVIKQQNKMLHTYKIVKE